MNELMNFRISSGLKNILGRELITNDNIAILELVKNSYDAGALKVKITFNEDTIIIADNGKGMSLDDLINKWLFVGYSAKRDGSEDASYRSKIKRHYAGAKGIGRMSCDRLAQNLTMITKSEMSAKTEKLTIDWNIFEQNQNNEFGNISFPHSSSIDIPYFPDKSNSGTILQFSKLRCKWSKEDISLLRKSLEKMINPFAETSDFIIEVVAPHFIDNDNKVRAKICEIELSGMDEEKKIEECAKAEQSIVNGPIINRMAYVLSLKTTQIESRLVNGLITTTLSDRGTLMYKIEEDNRYANLNDVSINLYYLNRKAKYNFSLKMGVDALNYGNIFLFRNGFRIYPYGEFDDDSWGLNKRAQQGYNRYLGTRDLIGRVDVETNEIDDFKEVSSRDGGLVETEASVELFDYFTTIHRFLERYVSGVLWGTNFISNNYFKDEVVGFSERKKVQEEEKNSENAKHIYDSIGSRVDFVQLIKNLANNSSVRVIDYNKKLADVFNNITELDKLQVQFVSDLRKVADRTLDKDLMHRIDAFENELRKLRLMKEEAERRALEEMEKRLRAEKQAAEEEIKRKEEEKKRVKVEKELELKTKQNLFLQSVGNLDTDRILNFHHDIRIQARTIENVLSDIVKMVCKERIDTEKLSKKLELVSRANARIISISQFATKANFNSTGDSIKADVVEYIYQYVTKVLPDYYNDINLQCLINECSYVIAFKPLEISLMIDNMLSNAVKAYARNFKIEFSVPLNKCNSLCISISDDGVGLSDEIADPQSVFLKGVSTTSGSGLGLYNVALIVEKQLCGKVMVDDTYKAKDNKGFKLLIKL